jgi:hypothetical protein
MRKFATAVVLFNFAGGVFAQQGGAGATALTIYNQDFAVARTTVDLDLTAGANQVTTTNVTSQVEPDSVVLRDPAGRAAFKIDEQNYDAGVIDQQSLLEKYEGKTIQFSRGTTADGKPLTVSGKIIRASQAAPLIEVDGVMQFQLPGTPLFPASTDGLLLKPTLRWEIDAAKAVKVNAELAYITHGMSWQATYNVVAPESKNVTGTEQAEVLGWVTIQNNCGTEFPQARIKLMAGDVAKLRDLNPRREMNQMVYAMSEAVSVSPGVTQQAFDDFHLYDLNRVVTLLAGETKQVQFLDAAGVTMSRIYEYDGGFFPNFMYSPAYRNDQPGFGLGNDTKVNVREEIRNSTANHLGIPLPAGRIRMYRRDAGGQMEFVGEGTIDHTPVAETVRIPVGSAFDVTGERKQTDFHSDQRTRTMDETFAIKVKNQKTVPVHVAVVEHLYRGQNWQILQQSSEFTKRDSTTVEFPVEVAAGGEKTVTYTAHYMW